MRPPCDHHVTTMLLSNLRAHLYSLYQGQHIAMETTAAEHNLVIPAQPNTSRSRENRECMHGAELTASSRRGSGGGVAPHNSQLVRLGRVPRVDHEALAQTRVRGNDGKVIARYGQNSSMYRENVDMRRQQLWCTW